MPTQQGISLNRQLSNDNPDGTTIGQNSSDTTFVNGTLSFLNGAVIQNAVISPAPFVFISSTITNATGITLAAASIAGGYITRSGPVAAFTDTTDTAVNIIAAYNGYGGVPVGTVSNLIIKNTTNFNETLTGGTGVTFPTGNIVPPNSTAYFQVAPTSTTAVTISLSNVSNGSVYLGNTQYTAAVNTTSFTATAPQVAGAVLTTLNLTGTLAGAASITLPTAANLIAGIPNAGLGTSYRLRIINSSGGAFVWTVVTNTGLTLSGTLTIAQNTWRDFDVIIGSASTVTVQAVGTGTQS